MNVIEREANEAIRATDRARQARRTLGARGALGGGAGGFGVSDAALAASGGRASGSGSGKMFSATSEGLNFFGIAKFSGTGLTMEGGGLLSKLGGRFIAVTAALRTIEGVTRGLTSIRDRVALGQDIGSATAQSGLDAARSIARGIAGFTGLEGIVRNVTQLIGGKSEEQASKMIEDFWDFFTLDATREIIRKDKEQAFRKQATDERNVKVESMRRELYANNNGWLRGMGVPMSQRHKDIEFTNWVNRRVEAEKARYDRIIQKGIEDEIYMG